MIGELTEFLALEGLQKGSRNPYTLCTGHVIQAKTIDSEGLKLENFRYGPSNKQ